MDLQTTGELSEVVGHIQTLISELAQMAYSGLNTQGPAGRVLLQELIPLYGQDLRIGTAPSHFMVILLDPSTLSKGKLATATGLRLPSL